MSALSHVSTVPVTTAIRRFAVHFLEMCVAMCAGGAVLNLGVFAAAAGLGHPNLVREAPELSIVIVAADLALAMAAYMVMRGHPSQHNIEMSGVTVLGAIPLVGALWLGMIPQAALTNWLSLFAAMCGPLCVLMFAVMCLRFEHYGGRIGSHAATPAPSRMDSYTCPMHSEISRDEPGRCPLCDMRLTPRRS